MASFKTLAKKAAETTDSKSSKNGTTMLQNAELFPAVKGYFEGHKMSEDGAALMAQANLKIAPLAEALRLETSRREGTCLSTIKVVGEDGAGILVICKNAYSKIEVKNEEAIKAATGDKFDMFFKTKTTVSMTQAFLDDEKAQELVLKALGEENFSKFFKVESTIAPTQAFHDQRATSPEVGNLFEKLANDGLVKPYAASFRKA